MIKSAIQYNYEEWRFQKNWKHLLKNYKDDKLIAKWCGVSPDAIKKWRVKLSTENPIDKK